MRKHLVALGAVVPAMFVSANALAAPTLLFSENWEDQAVANTRWQTSSTCNFLNGAAAPTSVADPTACSGKVLKDTFGASGGRVWGKKGAPLPVKVAVNDIMCVTAWVRGAAGAQPYVGVHVSNANGDIRQANANEFNAGEHWLLASGNFTDNFGGNATLMTNDGTWRRYTKEFKIRAQDITAGTYEYILPKTVNIAGIINGNCATPLANQTAAEFDDVRIYKLAAAGECPAAPPADESTHAICGTTTPICASTMVNNQPVFKCEMCDGNFGEAGKTKACNVATSPICATAGANKGSCSACDGDFTIAAATAACATTNPFCKNDGSCGKCTKDDDCKDATKLHGGMKCDLGSGSCTNSCGVDSEANDCKNPNKPWCNPTAGNLGSCADKLENGLAIPNRATDPDADKGKCTPANGTKFCASASCDTADDKCGLANGSACVLGEGAKCRATVCDTDGKCGVALGGSCNDPTECREGSCVSGLCALPTEDAGLPVEDSGTPVVDDAGSSGTSGTSGASGTSGTSGSSGDSGGGGCSTTGNGMSNTMPLVGIGLALGAVAIRRRRTNANSNK